MTVRTILESPDPRLRRTSMEVETFDAQLRTLVGDLFDTLYASGGIGLSAPQIGEAKQVLVMDLSGDRSAPEVYINPLIKLTGQRCMVEESCLSLPGLEAVVSRVNGVRVRALDVHGEVFERDLEDMHAVCMQHEMDHLAGRLFIDRLPMLRRWYVRGTAALQRRQQRQTASA